MGRRSKVKQAERRERRGDRYGDPKRHAGSTHDPRPAMGSDTYKMKEAEVIDQIIDPLD